MEISNYCFHESSKTVMKNQIKKLLTLVCILVGMSACTAQNPEVANNRNEAIARQLFEHFNNHDWKRMAALYTETAEFKDPSFGKNTVKQTRAQTIEKYSQLQQMFPDLCDSVIAIYPSGEQYITIEFVSKGRSPQGASFMLPICSILTIENGLITKDFTYYDNR